MNSVVVHYQEIALKGRNRPWFIARLVRNIRTATSGSRRAARRHEDGAHRDRARLGRRRGRRWRIGCAMCSASRTFRGRRSCRSTSTASRQAILDDLGDVRGLDVPRVGAARRQAVSADARRRSSAKSAAASRKRRDGPSISTNPEFTIHVEALTGEAFYHFGKEAGPGRHADRRQRTRRRAAFGRDRFAGCGYRLMKRGCRVIPVHFHSYPILSRASQEKVRELAALLTRYQQFTRLYMVAFGEIQQQVMLAVPPPLRVVIYRRLMLRIAQAIAGDGARRRARDRRGDRAGRVADAREHGDDRIGVRRCRSSGRSSAWTRKRSRSRRSGSARYPISIIEDQDCCQLFTPKHPATKARRERHRGRGTRRLPIDDFVRQAVESARRRGLQLPGDKIRQL